MRRLLLLLLVLTSMYASPQAVVTVNQGAVKHSAPRKIGNQFNAQTQYDNGQIYKNLFFNGHNAGNEPFTQTQIWQIDNSSGQPTLSTTQVQSGAVNANYDSVPENWWAGGTIEILQHAAAPGDVVCSSTITANTTAGTSPNGPVFTFAGCPQAPQVGTNFFKVQKTVAGTPTEYFCSGGGECSYQQADVCPECGTQTMRFNALSAPIHANLTNDQSSQTMHYLINGKTWTLTYKAKAASGSGTMTVAIKRGSNTICGPYTYTATSQWSSPTFTCENPTDGGGTPQALQATFDVSAGVDLLFDNADFEPTAGGDASNNTIFRDEWVHAWRDYYQNAEGAAGKPTCRYGPEPAASTMEDLMRPSQFTHNITAPSREYPPLENSEGFVPVGFPQFLTFAAYVGCNPYFIHPQAADTKESAEFVHWLKDSGATSSFEKIYIEDGNEAWNVGTFPGLALGFSAASKAANPGDTNYFDYMKRAGEVFGAMRGQESADGVGNIVHMVGVQTADGGAPSETVLSYAKADEVLINGYMMNRDLTDTSTADKIWKPTLTKPYAMTHKLEGVGYDSSGVRSIYDAVTALKVCGADGAQPCPLGTYEQNIHAYRGNVTQAALDGWVNGGGMGVVTFQEDMQFLDMGLDFQTTFAHQQNYMGSTSNSGEQLTVPIFGDIVECGGAQSQANGAECIKRPTFLGGQLANTAIIGSQVDAGVSGADACDLTADNAVNDVQAQPMPCEFAYAFVNGGQHTLALTNMDSATAHNVTLQGDVPPQGATVTVRQLAPGRISDTNEMPASTVSTGYTPTVSIGTTTQSEFNPQAPITLPPYSATVLTWSE